MIRECISDQDIMATFPIMHQLRPHLQEQEYLKVIRDIMHSDGFRLVGLFVNNICVACSGFRIMRKLTVSGEKILYVDDLVSDSNGRSKGYGKQLLNWLKAEAQRSGCETRLELDSGNQRIDAHRFYYREGLAIKAFHFYNT